MTSPRDPLQRPAELGPAERGPAAGGPGGGKARPPAPTPRLAAAGGLLAAIALLSGLALIVAGAALFVTLTRPVPTPAPSAAAAVGSCRTIAWDALPSSDTLPEGWTINGSGFYTDGYGASFSGPTPSGTDTAPALNVRVSCYGTDGHLAVTRSHQADLAVGGTDVAFADIGDEALASQDSSGTTTSVYLRRGQLVASIAAQGMSSADLEEVATAIDDGMVEAESTALSSAPAQPTGSSQALAPSAAPASESPEPTPTDSHAFPALEAVLPKAVEGTTLAIESTPGTDALSGDPTSDALFQWLTTVGKTADDLEWAEAYDPSTTVDVDFVALRVTGIASATLRQQIAKSWFGPDASVTTSTKSIGGKNVLVINYGDGAGLDYLFERGGAVVILSSSNAALVTRVLTALK